MSEQHNSTRTAGLQTKNVQILRRIAAVMIPASTEFGVPGADDDTIFADILDTAERDVEKITQALADIESTSRGRDKQEFHQLSDHQAETLLEDLRHSNPSTLFVLVSLVTQCYYRDDRVMQAIGMDARAPFPKGYTVEDGDYGLLDPVKARAERIYRDV